MQPAGHTRIYTTLTDATDPGLLRCSKQQRSALIRSWIGLATLMAFRFAASLKKTALTS